MARTNKYIINYSDKSNKTKYEIFKAMCFF